MQHIIIFASGRGSNARAIIRYFSKRNDARVALIVTNKAGAGVLDVAGTEGIPTLVTSGKGLGEAAFAEQLAAYRPALIVLAGFLLKIPPALIAAFRGRIVNIHPALLPAYGGKGMWGPHVHGAVLAAGDAQSGITVHWVDEEYDHGATILQARCPVLPGDDLEQLFARIQVLEHFWYPRAIEFLLAQTIPAIN